MPRAESGAGGAGLSPAGARAGEGGERSFEDLQRELEDIVARLEGGDVPVDEAIALFSRGEEVYRTCVERLEAARLAVEELVPKDPQGEREASRQP